MTPAMPTTRNSVFIMKRFQPTVHSSVRGFTLIEVLVVVIIVAILAAIAAPGWLAFLNRQRTTAVRSDLMQVLKNTQQDAIQRRQAITVEVVDDADAPTVSIRGLNQVLGSDSSNPGNLQLVATEDGEVTFDHQGLVTSPDTLPFVVSISPEGSNAQQCVIVATLLGNIKTAEGDTCGDPDVSADIAAD